MGYLNETQRHEFPIPFTPCRIAILTSIGEIIDVDVLLRYRKVWRIAGGIQIQGGNNEIHQTRKIWDHEGNKRWSETCDGEDC